VKIAASEAETGVCAQAEKAAKDPDMQARREDLERVNISAVGLAILFIVPRAYNTRQQSFQDPGHY
jgi:hypothetical protein